MILEVEKKYKLQTKEGVQVLAIWSDDDTRNDSREWDNVARLYLWHSNYNLGDKNNHETSDDLLQSLASDEGIETTGEEAERELLELLKNSYKIMPVYLYDHSGVSVSVAPFSCKFDSGWCGFAILSKQDAIKELGATEEDWEEKAEKQIKNEVEIYNVYISGEVCGFSLYEEKACPCCGRVELEYVDSCGGFYSTGDMLEYLPKEWQQAIKDETIYEQKKEESEQ